MSYKQDGHTAVGNRTVATLDGLRSIPTQGAGDVFQGQMVVVENIDYAHLVGASSGQASSLGPDEGSDSWQGPSQGYVELNAKHNEYLYSTFPVSSQSLVDSTSSGTSVGCWINPHKAPLTSEHQTIFHIPTLSVSDSPITNPYAPSLSVLGLSLHLAKHPITNKPGLLLTGSFTSPYEGTEVQGTLYQNYNGWVEEEISLHDWTHVVLALHSSEKQFQVWVNGRLVEVKQLATSVPDAANYKRVYINGEDLVTDHEIFIGASRSTDGSVGHSFTGFIDGFVFLTQYTNTADIRRLYGDGNVTDNGYAVANFITPVIHWPMGDYLTDFQAEDLLIQNHWHSGGYPSVQAVNCSSILNLKSRAMESQYNIVRTLRDQSDISKGYTWGRSFPPADDLVSRRSISMMPDTSDTASPAFRYLTSEGLNSEYWAELEDPQKGTISLTFYPPAESFPDPQPGDASVHALLSIGYNHALVERRQGIQIYVTRNSFIKDWSVVVVVVDKETGTEIPFYGQGNLSFDSWNTLVFSWDFSVEDGQTAATLYLNKMTLVSRVKGDIIPSEATAIKLLREDASRIQVGSSLYLDASDQEAQLNPWTGRIDDLLISKFGDPADHTRNVNPTLGTQIRAEMLAHYTFGDHSEDNLIAANSVYGEENRVQNVLNPGLPGKIKNDLHGVFVGPSDSSRLVFEDGFSGSSIPVPRDVPSNWGTYYWSADQDDWKTSYPDEIDYGFIHIRPADVGENEKGRWVSVISYTAWTAYLFGETESVLLEPGVQNSISEGDVATFTESGKVVPNPVIEQWVNPNLFPNNRPAPDSAGFKGQRCYDGYYMYECVAVNTWIRYLTEAFW